MLKVLLEKIRRMREELDDDKVFDVIGQQFSQISLKAAYHEEPSQKIKLMPQSSLSTHNSRWKVYKSNLRDSKDQLSVAWFNDYSAHVREPTGIR